MPYAASSRASTQLVLAARKARKQEAHDRGLRMSRSFDPDRKGWAAERAGLAWPMSCSFCNNRMLSLRNSLKSTKSPFCILSIIFPGMGGRAGEITRGAVGHAAIAPRVEQLGAAACHGYLAWARAATSTLTRPSLHVRRAAPLARLSSGVARSPGTCLGPASTGRQVSLCQGLYCQLALTHHYLMRFSLGYSWLHLILTGQWHPASEANVVSGSTDHV